VGILLEYRSVSDPPLAQVKDFLTAPNWVSIVLGFFQCRLENPGREGARVSGHQKHDMHMFAYTLDNSCKPY